MLEEFRDVFKEFVADANEKEDVTSEQVTEILSMRKGSTHVVIWGKLNME